MSKQLRANSPKKHSKKENQKQKEQKRNQNHSKSKSYWVAVFFPSLLSLAEKLVFLVWIDSYLIVKDHTVHLFEQSSSKSALSSQSLSLDRIDSLHSCHASHFPASRSLCPTPEQRPPQPLWSGERDAPRIPVTPSACRPAIVATGTSQTSFPLITSSHINTLFKLVKDNARSFVVFLRHAYCLLLLPMDVYKHRLIKSYLKPKYDCQWTHSIAINILLIYKIHSFNTTYTVKGLDLWK